MGVHEPGPSGMVLDLGRVTLALHGARTGCDFRPKARVENAGQKEKATKKISQQRSSFHHSPLSAVSHLLPFSLGLLPNVLVSSGSSRDGFNSLLIFRLHVIIPEKKRHQDGERKGLDVWLRFRSRRLS